MCSLTFKIRESKKKSLLIHITSIEQKKISFMEFKEIQRSHEKKKKKLLYIFEIAYIQSE